MACDVLAGRIETPGGFIYEDDYWVIDHSISPVLLRGFLIVKPKLHCESIAELDVKQAGSLSPLLHKTTTALTRVLRPERVYVCSFGESVKHLHFYVIPRTSDMPDSGLEVLNQLFRGRWACTDAEAAGVATQVREEMSRQYEESKVKRFGK